MRQPSKKQSSTTENTNYEAKEVRKKQASDQQRLSEIDDKIERARVWKQQQLELEKSKSWRIGGFDSRAKNSKTDWSSSEIHSKKEPSRKQQQQSWKYLNEDMDPVDDSDSDDASKMAHSAITAPTQQSKHHQH